MPASLRPPPHLARPIALGLILALGLAFAFYQIGGPSLWLDEAFTWWLTQFPAAEMLEAVRVQGVHPPLYHIISSIAVDVLGQSEVGLRAVSAIAHGIAIVGVYLLGRRLGGSTSGLTAAALWALHPMAIWYAREARPYALAAALSAFAAWQFLRARANPSHSNLAAAWLILAAGLLTHYFFLTLIGSFMALALLEIRSRPGFFRRWAGVTLLALLPVSLWVIWFFAQDQPMFAIEWIERPSLADLPATFWNLLSGYGGQTTSAAATLGMLSGALLVGMLTRAPDRGRNWRLGLAMLVLPLAAVWSVSHLRPVYVDRYFLVILPEAVALVGCGVLALSRALESRGRYATLGPSALVLLVVLAGAWAAWRVHTDPIYSKEDWRGLARAVAPQGTVQSSIWPDGLSVVVPLIYYLGSEIPVLESPSPATCIDGCWFVTRKPYTATHAFGSAVQEPDRPWTASAPAGCQESRGWRSETGIAALWIVCVTSNG